MVAGFSATFCVSAKPPFQSTRMSLEAANGSPTAIMP